MNPDQNFPFIPSASDVDSDPLHHYLLERIRERLPKLEALLEETSARHRGEDRFYRFYHQSLKLYDLQKDTEAIVAALRGVMPNHPLNEWFLRIIEEGTGKQFQHDHHVRWLEWLEETRPILEAYFHARTMLEFAVRYGRALPAPPRLLPSGWAAVLYLYNMR